MFATGSQILWGSPKGVTQMGRSIIHSICCDSSPRRNRCALRPFGAVDSICTRMKVRVSIAGFVLAAVALVVPRAPAQDGLRGAFTQLEHVQRDVSALAPADFDNDSRPDGAVLSKAGWLNGQRLFRIDLHLTAGKDASIDFHSVETDLEIAAVDVNRDGAPDIVVERPLTHQRVEVFLNDGYGVFQRVASNSFSYLDEATAQWCPTLAPLYLPVAILPSLRGFELPEVRVTVLVDTDHAQNAHDATAALLAQCAAHAPSAPRAPPSVVQS